MNADPAPSGLAPARYTATAIRLHWLIALAIACTFAVGLYMQGLPLSPWKLKVYSWHKWTGVCIFLLVLARLAWRLGHRPPALPETMPLRLRQLAEATHWLLYLLMFAVPISGWLMSSAKGFPVVLFGVLPIPDLLAKNPPLGDQLVLLHQTLNFLLLGLVIGHVGAALKHHFIDRDDVLRRMLSSR
ncbi:cytochrome b [Denitratisoma oestradiolicum]|uniref:Cytochrome B561 n=1 Tax=Denitratisoma oestradiolicum TaxID=311182 RepID=A0A6S6XVZ8_9PROT|nr:cytochrome b [Denitratisoma oestradiolicum]TWO79235.1 cytochrome b [Denitratisoma oestradiolicum]CAB1368237.1 Cytochrome B561 [Denitratisoma oestradiolicum]